jgi:hypothetical protein
MNCPAIQRYLLRVENPNRVSARVRDHLEGCPSCQAWHHGLVQIENDVLLLPIESSEAKSAFMQKFVRGTVGVPSVTARSWLPWQARERARRKLAFAASLAAALLLFALGWWIVQRAKDSPAVQEKAQPESIVKWRQDVDGKLARAKTPRARLDIYRETVNHLSKALSKKEEAMSGDELASFVDVFDETVVRGGMVAEAEKLSPALSPAERKEIFTPLVEKLEELSAEAKYRARYREGTDALQLTKLALAAENGARKLGNLIEA